jgi:flagellar motor protein MotB
MQEKIEQEQRRIEENIEQLQNAEQVRRNILHEIKDELAAHNIIVAIADNETVLRIPEETLTFDSSSDEIPADEKIQKAVETIGVILHRAINRPFRNSKNGSMRFEYLDTVFIEGHTDSRPFTMSKNGNWGLSSSRAISLWKFWEERLSVSPPFAVMENAFGQKLFSVSGYAASRRLQLLEDTAEQRRRNRRIDIRFTVKRPSISELKDIVK